MCINDLPGPCLFSTRNLINGGYCYSYSNDNLHHAYLYAFLIRAVTFREVINISIVAKYCHET